MNMAELHISLNHIPPLFTILGTVVLAVAAVRKSGDAKKAALWIFVLSALFTIPVFLTGDPAAAIVGPSIPTAEHWIHPHEEWADRALVANLLLGVVALADLLIFRRSRHIPRGWTTVTMVVAVAASLILFWTAALGGRIHHPEARPGFVPPPAHAAERAEERE